MILLKSNKINTFSEKSKINCDINLKFQSISKNIIQYESTTNFEYIECPHCHSNKLISYGTYERNVVLSYGKCKKISIKRVMCKCCGKTHALIPTFIKPYYQYESSFIDFIMILINIRKKSNKELVNILKLSRQIIRQWKIRFEEHLIRLKTTYNNEKIKLLLKHLFEVDFIFKYYKVNGIPYFSKITNITFS